MITQTSENNYVQEVNSQNKIQTRQVNEEAALDRIVNFFRNSIQSQIVQTQEQPQVEQQEKETISSKEKPANCSNSDQSQKEPFNPFFSLGQKQQQLIARAVLALQAQKQKQTEKETQIQLEKNTQMKPELLQSISASFYKLDVPIKFLSFNQKKKRSDWKIQSLKIEISRIENLPLYGIDHSKQFFETHPILSMRKKIEQTLSEYFCDNNGIDLKCYFEGLQLNQQMKMSGPQLKEIMSIVFLTTWRKMEHIINLVYKKKIIRVENKHLEPLLPFLLNSKTTLKEKHMQALIKVIKLAFDLPSSPIQKQTQGLYIYLLGVIDGEESQNIQFIYGDKQISEQFEWNHQKTVKLCELFLKNNSVRDSLEQFKANYNCDVNITELRLKLQQIEKNILLLINTEILRKNTQTDYFFLNERDYRVITRDPKAIALQKILLKIYMQGQVFLKDLIQVVKQIENIFYKQHDTKHNHKIAPEVKNRKKNIPRQKTQSQRQQSQEQDSESEEEPVKTKLKKMGDIEKKKNKQLTLSDSFLRRKNTNQNSITKNLDNLLSKAGSKKKNRNFYARKTIE